MDKDYKNNSKIKWNFTKFLIDRDGNIVARFEPTDMKNLKEKIGKIVCFGTSAMMRSMKKPMKKLTEAYGIRLSDEEFHCRGEFKFANKGRPNANDLENAALFTERVVKANE